MCRPASEILLTQVLFMWLTPHATADTFSVMRESGRAAGATESPLSVSVYLHRSQPYNLSQPTRFPQPKQHGPRHQRIRFKDTFMLCISRTADACCEFVWGSGSVAARVMFTYTTHVVHLQDKWLGCTQPSDEDAAPLPFRSRILHPCSISLLT